MKLAKICLAGICLVALAGCNQKSDPQIAKQEERITALESNVVELTQRCDSQRDYAKRLFSMQESMVSNYTAAFGNVAAMITNQENELTARGVQIDLLNSAVTNLLLKTQAK